MTTIAGMDLGYGSQVKIVRTNYLVQGCYRAQPLLVLQTCLLLQGNSGQPRQCSDYVSIASAGTAAGAFVAEAPTADCCRVIAGKVDQLPASSSCYFACKA